MSSYGMNHTNSEQKIKNLIVMKLFSTYFSKRQLEAEQVVDWVLYSKLVHVSRPDFIDKNLKQNAY